MLLIPTLAALGLGGLRMASAVRDSADATRAASIANALPWSFRLALQLQVERDTGSAKVPAKALAQVRATTDAAIQAWRVRLLQVDTSHDAKLRQDLGSITGVLGNIDGLRAELAAPGTRLVGQTEYTNTLNLLLGLAGRLPEVGAARDLYRQSSALSEVRTAAEALADERTLVTKALADGEISDFDLAQLATAAATYAAASGHFYDNTSVRAQHEFETINGGSGDLFGSHAPMQAAVGSLLSTGDPETMHLNPATWNAASGDFLAQMAGVITTAATDLAKEVDGRRVSAQHDAVVSAVTVFVVLLLALIATVIVARSILRPLNRLRDAALDIARHGLPERVRALEDSDEAGDLSVSPIYVGSQDEIAEVADAFDAVHAEAVRLAGEQTQMRANVNKMFVNLSRRSQSLVERQLRLIDELESGEQDPEHLSNLFRLDHLATRMRRNDESLMVLAGGDTGQAARGPVAVLDVLRAASSEVEQFARVEIESGETAKFRGSVAGDLVHLLAELIENATNFSPPDSPVVVRSSRTSPLSPLVIEIRDLGIGMTPHELDAANDKLHSSGGLDADVARMMGLVVASRLADRHGLSVELRANSPRGVVARVEVPTGMLVQPETRSALLVEAVDPLVDPLAEPLPELLTPLTPSPSLPEQLKLPERPAEPVSPVAAEPAPPSADAPSLPSLPTRPVASTPLPPSTSSLPGAPMPPSVRPPEGYTPTSPPVASEPPVKSWFTTTVPLRDPEELLNNYLTGRAEGVGGAIKNPLSSIAKRNGSPLNGSGNGTADGTALNGTALNGTALNGIAPVAPVDRAGDTPAEPGEPAWDAEPEKAPESGGTPGLTSSGLPTRIPRNNLPLDQPFDAFGSGAAPEPTPEPVAPQPQGPVLDPLIAELAADVLSAPSAEEALAEAEDNEDDTSIFATLQSEWFTRRTPLEARRAQPDVLAAEPAATDDWTSPGDEGWRRAAELSEPEAEEESPLTADGLPVRVPGRNLVPGSAAPTPVIPAAAENVVPMPRLERRRTRGLSNFQQGVSRARTTDTVPVDSSDEITVPDAYEAAETRAHEEHQ
ncbi:nitrate- and nitrite sensing domain-containing protein [Nocardioides sp. CER19]|uniref:nitrate- and nitrite sensing domain-containing protein n=1 Tax=Nocardioides sp. CER19 TaxID=3038538 RepID=UPI0024477E94|nr:nitrate- and nitrite sensing domain-containing protein [Nocardioides sp. CER19]MDH2415315.1 nitrate- and nitrite sensing domain-containing protein [Nocardioides sp. CER19]